MNEPWYVGSWEECPRRADLPRIPWGEVPTDEQREVIESLVLRPSASEVLPAVVPGWVAELPRCRELTLTILHLAELRPEQLPPMLDALVFEAFARWLGPEGTGAPSWPSTLVLPGLRGLTITGNMRGLPEGVRPELVPALASVSAFMDKRGELIDRLAGFGCLRELELFAVGNLDVFEPLDGAIELVRLRNGGRHFPFEAISRWPTIERLDVYDLQGTIDCAVLAELPRLRELRIAYSRKVTGVEALLECPELRSITITNCGRPFKDAALKQAFDEHGFELLEISRA